MAFHTLPPVSSGISLLPQSSFLGLLPRRRFSSGNSLKLLSRKAPVRTALLEEVEAWRSTLQHYDPLVLLSPLAVIPVLVAIPRTTRTFRDSVCTRLQDFVAEVMALHNSGWGTVLTVLILGNAFYSDIAPPSGLETFENIPQELNQSGYCHLHFPSCKTECKFDAGNATSDRAAESCIKMLVRFCLCFVGGDKPRRIQKPKSKKAENCTQKCLGTCIRGGAGSPGEGPFNVRRPLIVFKEGFRSRQYCLIECSEICNLIGDGDDGP